MCNQQEATLGPLAAGKHVQQTTRSFSKVHSADELLEPEVGSIVLHARSIERCASHCILKHVLCECHNEQSLPPLIDPAIANAACSGEG